MSIHTDAQKETKRGSFGYKDSELYKFMLKYVLPYRRDVILVLLYMGLNSFFTVLGPMILMNAIDRFSDAEFLFGSAVAEGYLKKTAYAIYANINIPLVWIQVTLLSLLYLFIQIMIYFISRKQIMKIAEIGLRAELDIRIQLFDHLQHLDMSYHDKNEVGRIMSRLTSDLGAIRQMLGGQVINNIANMITVIAVLFVILRMDPYLSIVSIVFIPVAIIIGGLARKYARPRRKETRRTNSILMANIGEAIAGIKVTKGMNREYRNIEVFEKLNKDNYLSNISADSMGAVFFPMLLSLSSLGTAFILYFGGLRVIYGAITLGALTAFLNYNAILFRPVINLGQFYQQLQDALTGAERVKALLDTETKVPRNDHLPPMPRINGDVLFDHIAFEYIPGEPVYTDFYLDIKAGQTVALVGKTGAGKSTVINILSRMYDIKDGDLKIDGRSVFDYSLKSYRDQIAVVPQDFFLFADSIAENLKLGRPDVTEDEMWKALEKVGLKEYVERMPNGLYTHLQERGGRLSVGQRQLLILAAVIIADPRILILDEATASIDMFSELLIQEALEQIVSNRTAFIIAHRLSTIKNADLIVVIDHGEIMEMGTHEELLNKKGMYYNLVRNQIELANISS